MREVVFTPDAPMPVGPYSQAILANDTLYVSGQVAIDPKTNGLIAEAGDVTAETTQVMKNLEAVLKAADMTFENVVKCEIFMADMRDYAAVNAVYATCFDADTAPARAAVEVANLPLYVKVEISCIAVK